MKNKIGLRKLSRTSAHRVAMLRTMVTQLVHHDRIKTTVPKAKELRRIADKMVTWAKIGSHPYRVKALGYVRDRQTVDKLWTVLAERYRTRVGGYCRVMRCGFRTGDRAPMAIIEYVDREGEVRPSRPPMPQRGVPGGGYTLSRVPGVVNPDPSAAAATAAAARPAAAPAVAPLR